jgi:hypothetical protein
MPKSRARVLGRPIPLLIVATAVLIGTFSGVGYAASSRSAPTAAKATATAGSSWASAKSSTTTTVPVASKLVFHALTLLNGAKSAQGYGTGAPQYAVSAEGVVYLAGSLMGPANQSLPAFVMPKGARPGYYDCFSVYSEESAQVLGVLHIYANGQALVQGPGTSDFYSLAGVSYVVGY